MRAAGKEEIPNISKKEYLSLKKKERKEEEKKRKSRKITWKAKN